MARSGAPVQPDPVPVVVHRLDLLAVNGHLATIQIHCSAGFYVRALAQALGARTGAGACLQSLRRVRSGGFGLPDAVSLETILKTPQVVASYMRPLGRLLTHLPTVVLTTEGCTRVSHGRDVERPHALDGWPDMSQQPASGHPPAWIRLTSSAGELLALAQPAATPDVLHPSVVLR